MILRSDVTKWQPECCLFVFVSKLVRRL